MQNGTTTECKIDVVTVMDECGRICWYQRMKWWKMNAPKTADDLSGTTYRCIAMYTAETEFQIPHMHTVLFHLTVASLYKQVSTKVEHRWHPEDPVSSGSLRLRKTERMCDQSLISSDLSSVLQEMGCFYSTPSCETWSL
jgi:hypothetical protein